MAIEPMQLQLQLQHQVTTAVTASPHVRAVASMFGLGLDRDRPQVVVPPTTLKLCAGQVVLITGPSGSGKSTLVRLIAAALEGGAHGGRVLRFEALAQPSDVPLVDQFDDLPLERVLWLLSRAGLSDAFVMLRRPCELSDGQRYRFNLARCFAMTGEQRPAAGMDFPVILADEFGATLDRTTAMTIAAHARKWVTPSGVCLIVATTHDDLLEALAPDVLIDKPLGGELHMYTRGRAQPESATP